MYGNGDKLDDILQFGNSSLIDNATIDYLKNINSEKGSYAVYTLLLKENFLQRNYLFLN